MKFKVGDQVRFSQKMEQDKEIENFIYYKIPSNLIIHGNVMLGSDYFRDFGRIIAIANHIYIVRWLSAQYAILQLGFEEKDLRPVFTLKRFLED